MSKFFIYAIVVVLCSAGSSWTRMRNDDKGSGNNYRGSPWSSHTGSWGGGSGGGGHK